MSASPAPGGPEALEALKRVKATEQEWQQKLETERRSSEAMLQRLREESDATVKAILAEAERARADTVA